MRSHFLRAAAAAFCLSLLVSPHGHAEEDKRNAIGKIVAATVQPLMADNAIPGASVGIVKDTQSYVYNYGVMSKATGEPVTDDTLFEIGSISKTFTATLAAYAQTTGHLSLSDHPGKYLEAVQGTSFDKVSLLDLGTHASGGFPLQVPDDITNDDQLMRYLQDWQPTYAPGTYRTYANPTIGLLGLITARSMGSDFATLVQDRLFRALGMKHSYLDVPQTELGRYAQGYSRTDVPVRLAPGMLAAEAYGVRATSRDMVRFVQANMGLIDLPGDLQRSIIQTHTGYYRVGAMTQDLIWEQYAYPVDLNDLLAGNAPEMGSEPHPVEAFRSPLPPQDNVLINKTGSTNGFAAYVAFVPRKKIGIVLLANKNYPLHARVIAAHEILMHLADDPAGG